MKLARPRIGGAHQHDDALLSSIQERLERLAAHVRNSVPKQTIPSPSVVHFRGGRQAIDQTSYPSLEPFFADLGAACEGNLADDGALCQHLRDLFRGFARDDIDDAWWEARVIECLDDLQRDEWRRG